MPGPIAIFEGELSRSVKSHPDGIENDGEMLVQYRFTYRVTAAPTAGRFDPFKGYGEPPAAPEYDILAIEEFDALAQKWRKADADIEALLDDDDFYCALYEHAIGGGG